MVIKVEKNRGADVPRVQRRWRSSCVSSSSSSSYKIYMYVYTDDII